MEYTLPLRMARPPVLVVNNEFFLVPWDNPFFNAGSSYTQYRFQMGVRFPIADSFSRLGLTSYSSRSTSPVAGTQRNCWYLGCVQGPTHNEVRGVEDAAPP